MTCPFGFLVVLPDQMLLIPVDSHFSWLTMFYMLPKELVETVCLLSKHNAKHHIEVGLNLDELDLTNAEKTAT